MLATIQDVAKNARVSKATVSRVISGNAVVSPEVQARVREVMKALDYRPNSVAQNLATRRSNAVGLVVSVLDSPYFGMIMAAVEEIIQIHGMHLIVVSDHQQQQRERDAIDFLLQRRCDGLVVHADALDDEELATLVQATATPMVLINRQVAGLGQYCIHNDDALGGQLAVEHLVERGHRRIGCITGPMTLHESQERLTGYHQGMQAAGLESRTDWVVEADFSIAGGVQGITTLLDRHPDITAVFAHNDQMAAGVLDACRSRGMQLPRDLSVVGFDDVVWAQYLQPRLTTIRQPVHAMGVAAGRLLLRILGREQADSELKTRFQPALIQRESVGVVG